MKRKIRIEYPLNSASGNVVWNAVSTPSGLQRWFADDVSKNAKTYIFKWGKTETRNAAIINYRSEYFIRFHWEDEEPKTYFEFKINYNELTNEHLLEITDFATRKKRLTSSISGIHKSSFTKSLRSNKTLKIIQIIMFHFIFMLLLHIENDYMILRNATHKKT